MFGCTQCKARDCDSVNADGISTYCLSEHTDSCSLPSPQLLEWWNHVAYLGYRLPVVVHSNPAIGFPRQPCGNRDQYVETAARFILSLLKWNMLIQK